MERLGSILGRLGCVLERPRGASWALPGSLWDLFGAKKLVSSAVLGTFWGVLEASWGRLGRLGASWKYLVRVFHTRRWLHVGLASEMPFFIGFLFNLSSNFNLQNYVNSVSRQRKTYKSNKIIFKDNMPSFRLPKPTQIASWRPLGASWSVLEAFWGVLGVSWNVLGASWGVLGRKIAS